MQLSEKAIKRYIIKNILKTIRKEFRVFKEEQLEFSPNQIFDNCGVIYAYSNLYDFFEIDEDNIIEMLGNMFTEEQLKWFNEEIEQPLSSLFNFYIDEEFQFVSNSQQIEELLKEYVEKFYKG